MGSSVLIVDDHELFATALRMALSSHGIDAYQVVPASLEQVILRAGEITPGLVALDLDLGDSADGEWLHGTDIVGALCTGGWSVLVVSASVSDEHLGTANAIAAGAIGALHKSSSFEVLVHTVLRAAAGQPVMTEQQRNVWLSRAAEGRRRVKDLEQRFDRLSKREREVLDLAAQGYRATAIAEHFTVSMTTVRTQIRMMLTKLGVNSQLEAVALLHELRARTRPDADSSR